MRPKPIPLFVLLSTLLLLLPAAASARSACGQFAPTDSGESHLPPGYDNVSWGMSGVAVQAIRGQEMERQADLRTEDVYYLFEMFPETSSTIRVRYTFYKDRLMEVLRYLDPGLIHTREAILLTKFEEEFGPPDDQRTFRDPEQDEDGVTAGIAQRVWLWCDRFSEHVLFRMLDINEVRVRCSSRIYRQQLFDELTSEADRAMWESLDGLQIR